MAKIAFTTLGCKLNYAETSTYERALLSAGHEAVAWNEVAETSPYDNTDLPLTFTPTACAAS